ncbi:MAG: hypothetical protein OEO77_04035 [Acidimicrobiia bacterium]|nr:hypothetical protein [Acidimicrobiia bacterium]
MTSPADLIRDAAHDEWADPIATTRKAVAALLEMTDGEWETEGLAAVQMLRTRRPDSALFLAATEVALEPNHMRAADGLRAMLTRLDDTTWAAELGLRVSHFPSLGLLSLGTTTMEVVAAALDLGGSRAQLFTDRLAIRRGFLRYETIITVAPPEEASCLLLPAIARQDDRIWTTVRAADAALRASTGGRSIVPVVHPAATLSPLNRLAYRPAPNIVDVAIAS